jgi:hypothetical protein
MRVGRAHALCKDVSVSRACECLGHASERVRAARLGARNKVELRSRGHVDSRGSECLVCPWCNCGGCACDDPAAPVHVMCM